MSEQAVNVLRRTAGIERAAQVWPAHAEALVDFDLEGTDWPGLALLFANDFYWNGYRRAEKECAQKIRRLRKRGWSLNQIVHELEGKPVRR